MILPPEDRLLARRVAFCLAFAVALIVGPFIWMIT